MNIDINSKNETNRNTNLVNEEFSNLDYYMLSNYICFNATIKFINTFNSDYIPKSFFKFYIEELQQYKTCLSVYLKNYFIQYNLSKNICENELMVYAKSFTQFIKLKKIEKYSILAGLKPDTYIVINRKEFNLNLDYKPDNKNVAIALNDIKIIADKIKNNTEIRNFSARYKLFLDSKPSVKTSEIINLQKKEKKVETTPLAPKPKTKKVMQLRIPKLKLPYSYPKNMTISRVDSAYFPVSFFSSARLVEIVNNRHINGIAFTKGFVEKRNALYNKKGDKFSDFF